MSHRTKDLPPLRGVAHTIRELRHKEIARQLLAVVLIFLYTITSQPIAVLVWIGLTMAAAGMLVRLYASGYVLKNEQLATTGPYSLVRHPLYTGNILLVIGFAIAASLWWTIPLSVFFFWFYYPTAIEYEDRKLHRYFGETWQRWADSTPALMPGLKSPRGLFEGGWSLEKSAKRNGEFYIAAFLIVCMIIVVWRGM